MNRAALSWLTIILWMTAPSRPVLAADPDTFSPVVAYQYLDSLATPDAPTPIFSPVVSYQYLDSLSAPDAPTTILSPIVAYQYFDWPGDENLTFTNSANVSYYFNGAPQILTQPLAQAIKAGQTATLSVAAGGSAPLTYVWRLNGFALPNSSGPLIQVSSAKLSDSGSYSVVVSNAYGSVVSIDAKVVVYTSPSAPQPPVPTSTPATELLSPVLTAKPTIPTNTQLVGTYDSSKQFTIVLTHGWIPAFLPPASTDGAGGWPTDIESALISSGVNANVFLWDWHGQARTTDPSTAANRTVSEGTALGQALMDTLGPNYNGPIHFLGHSLGTIVNCAAADYIHGSHRPKGDVRSSLQVFDARNTQVTLFDEAELVTAVKGLHVGWDVVLASDGLTPALPFAIADAAQQVRNFWSKVIPDHCAWADNYVSEVGLLHADAANAMLWRETNLLDPATAHGYASTWYRKTIVNPNPTASPMGFRFSFERYSLGSAPALNTYFLQANSELNLQPIASADAYRDQRDRLIGFPALVALQTLSGAEKVAVQAIDTISTSAPVQFVGNLTAGIGELLAPQSGRPVYLGNADSTPAFFTNSDQSTVGSMQAKWDLQLSVQAGTVQTQQVSAFTKLGVSVLADPATANVAYTIIPVHVPTEAIGISFEYKVEGAAVEEFVTMGVADQKLFTMEAKFLDDSQWNGTPVMDISGLRNQDVKLAFAMNGSNGPPTGKLTLRNIQFLIPPRPQLTLSLVGSALTVAWPLSAPDWTLEAQSDLTLGAPWQPQTGAPDDTEYFHTMTFDISKTPKSFFRLRK